MRGTPDKNTSSGAQSRITPAHAGNTIIDNTFIPLIGDHPRPCGEHAIMGFPIGWTEGSPPPMRGTLEWFKSEFMSLGITPAHAGNTARPVRQFQRPWDHPRPCGEHCGKRRLHQAIQGITPAHAGNTHCYANRISGR